MFNKTTESSDFLLVFKRENVLDKSNESTSSVLCNSESKPESGCSNKSPVPTPQFLLQGFSAPYRPESNLKGGGTMLYIREDKPFTLLNSKSNSGIETISVEINLRKRKWFLNCSYNPNENLISNHLECLNGIMDEFSKNYDKVVFLGDFNTSINDNAMTSFYSLN